MSEAFSVLSETIPPADEPTCCPDAYLCLSGALEMECPRHGGFDVCCSNPSLHIPQDPKVWHQEMERWERSLLNAHARRYEMLQAFGFSEAWVSHELNTFL